MFGVLLVGCAVAPAKRQPAAPPPSYDSIPPLSSCEQPRGATYEETRANLDRQSQCEKVIIAQTHAVTEALRAYKLGQIDAAQAEHQRRMALAASMDAIGRARTTPGGCASDFACGAGYRCVKPNYSATGTCARAVDAQGVPTFQPSSTGSVGPKLPSKGDCSFDTDCSPGFRCDTASGACVR